MTIQSVQYKLRDQVATIRIDDGKRNALLPQVLREIYQALDQAESCAKKYKEFDVRAHAASKRRIRTKLIRKIRFSIPLDLLGAILMGLQGARPG